MVAYLVHAELLQRGWEIESGIYPPLKSDMRLSASGLQFEVEI